MKDFQIQLNEEIPEEIKRTGYWFRASNYHIFIIELTERLDDNGTVMNVFSRSFVLDTNCVNEYLDFTKIKNGQKVSYVSVFDESEWQIELNVWGKYYFPKFNEDQNQWYHKMNESDNCYIEDFTNLLKFMYEISIKETGLKTY